MRADRLGQGGHLRRGRPSEGRDQPVEAGRREQRLVALDVDHDVVLARRVTGRPPPPGRFRTDARERSSRASAPNCSAASRIRRSSVATIRRSMLRGPARAAPDLLDHRSVFEGSEGFPGEPGRCVTGGDDTKNKRHSIASSVAVGKTPAATRNVSSPAARRTRPAVCPASARVRAGLRTSTWLPE